MKKVIGILICILTCFCLGSIDVTASTNTFDRTADNNYLVSGEDITITESMLPSILSTPAVDASEKVYDFADLLTVREEEELFKEITDFIEKYNLDLAIATINENIKDSTKTFAHDFYDYNDFGIGEKYSGLLFLVDMANREFYMATTGEAIAIYNDNIIDNCLSTIQPYFAKEKYAEGTFTFVEQLKHYAADETAKNLTGIDKVAILPWGTITIFALITTAVVMYILINNNKLARQANSSRHYLTKADVILENEIFLGRSVTKTARSHESSSGGGISGGGSSTSSGSSGRSHGGGGRSF